MFFGRFLFSLVLSSTALQAIEGRLLTSYAVELSTCDRGSDASAFAEQCTSVCQPVYDAQKTCEGNVACTCTTAPVSAVNACVQCHLDEVPVKRSREAAFLVPSKLIAYSQLCGPSSTADSLLEIDTRMDATAVAGRDAPALEGRETFVVDALCIYGLPDVAGNNLVAFVEAQRKLWPYVLFVFVVVVCILQRRSKSS